MAQQRITPRGLGRLALLPARPLFRLLAVNLGVGIVLAVFTVTGLLLIDPQGLRGLLFADRSGAVALALMLFGFVVTFGSCVMGSAIMLLGEDGGDRGRRAPAQTEPLPVRLPANS